MEEYLKFCNAKMKNEKTGEEIDIQIPVKDLIAEIIIEESIEDKKKLYMDTIDKKLFENREMLRNDMKLIYIYISILSIQNIILYIFLFNNCRKI
jgi:hypothetical protein